MDTENIDSNGFRENVGIILFNSENKLLLASRIGKKGWQFPQGGIHISENPEKAMYRELYEEIGLEQNDVTIIDKTKEWLKYQLPDQYIRKDSKIHCIGQKQIWFLLRLNCDEAKISLQKTDNPEFEYWQWVPYWKPVSKVIFFKRQVYNAVLDEFSRSIFNDKIPDRPKWWPRHWKKDCEREPQKTNININ